MSVNMEEVVSATFDDVPDDKEASDGTYILEVIKYNFDHTRKEDPKPYLELTLRVIEVLDAEGLTNDDVPNIYPVRDKLFLSAKSLKRTKKILEGAFEVDTEGKSRAQVAEELLGRQVKGVIKVRSEMVNGEERTYINVDKYMKAA